MLTFPIGSNTTVMTASPSTGTLERDLVYQFDELCTFFDHDATQDSFSGIAAIGGGIVLNQSFALLVDGTTVTPAAARSPSPSECRSAR